MAAAGAAADPRLRKRTAAALVSARSEEAGGSGLGDSGGESKIENFEGFPVAPHRIVTAASGPSLSLGPDNLQHQLQSRGSSLGVSSTVGSITADGPTVHTPVTTPQPIPVVGAAGSPPLPPLFVPALASASASPAVAGASPVGVTGSPAPAAAASAAGGSSSFECVSTTSFPSGAPPPAHSGGSAAAMSTTVSAPPTNALSPSPAGAAGVPPPPPLYDTQSASPAAGGSAFGGNTMAAPATAAEGEEDSNTTVSSAAADISATACTPPRGRTLHTGVPQSVAAANDVIGGMLSMGDAAPTVAHLDLPGGATAEYPPYAGNSSSKEGPKQPPPPPVTSNNSHSSSLDLSGGGGGARGKRAAGGAVVFEIGGGDTAGPGGFARSSVNNTYSRSSRSTGSNSRDSSSVSGDPMAHPSGAGGVRLFGRRAPMMQQHGASLPPPPTSAAAAMTGMMNVTPAARGGGVVAHHSGKIGRKGGGTQQYGFTNRNMLTVMRPAPPPGAAPPLSGIGVGAVPPHCSTFNAARGGRSGTPPPPRLPPPPGGAVGGSATSSSAASPFYYPYYYGDEVEKESNAAVSVANIGVRGRARLQNDYTQHFVDAGERPQNFIRDCEEERRFMEYPKLERLMKLKKYVQEKRNTPSMCIQADLRNFDWNILGGIKFDVLLVDPPWQEYYDRCAAVDATDEDLTPWSLKELMNLGAACVFLANYEERVEKTGCEDV